MDMVRTLEPFGTPERQCGINIVGARRILHKRVMSRAW